MDRAFIVIPERSLSVLLIHKCGSSSLVKAAAKLGYQSRVHPVEEMARYSTRAVMIREPHARLESAWAALQNGAIHDAHGYRDFSAWVVDVCEGHFADMHVEPVATFTEGFNPTHVCRWDFEQMGKLIGTPIPHCNGGAVRHSCEWTRQARRAFAAAYASDLALWVK